MSLARFRYFERVARLGSIREAADALHVASSAISRQISYLEDEFGVALFERQARGMKTTPAGQLLLQHVRGLLDHHAQARASIEDLQGLRRGHVRVWSVEGMVKDFVSPVLAVFQSDYAAISVELNVASSDRIVAAILDDEADIGVAFNPPKHRAILESEPLIDPLLAIMSPQHEAAAAHSLTLAEAVRWPIALPDASFGLRHVVDIAASAAKLELAPTLITNSIEALRSFARAGRGLSFLPRHSIAQDLALSLLSAIPVRDRAMRASVIKLCTRRERLLPLAAAELLQRFAQASRALQQRSSGDAMPKRPRKTGIGVRA